MGALTSLTKWIPEDDLLLKNAVEAGASLESLAKGAVQFSRRYTIRDLRDRWHSLLYDLDTSIEASSRMVEIEIELAASNLPKATRACNTNSKGNEISSTKRKADCVRNHYYAMRKRIRSKPCSFNLSYFEPPALLAATECDNDSREQFMADSKHPADNYEMEVPFPEDYGHPGTGYASAHHVFPELMRGDPAAANGNVAYHAVHLCSVEGVIPDGPSGEGCLIAYPENISSMPHDEAEGDNGSQSFERNFQQRDFPNILGENLIDTSSEIHEIAQPNALGESSLYKEEDIGAKPLSHFDSSNNSCEDFCTNFVRKDNISPHGPEDGGSFHHPSTYLSFPSGMPTWRTMEDSSTPTMLTEGHYGDKTQRLLHMDDHKNINAPGCDVASSEPKLDDRMCGAGLNNPNVMPENDFIDFPDTYMDFDDDENLLFMEVNEKDNTDKPCGGLSSILLNSPGDTHRTTINNDLGPTNALDACLEIPDAACSRELNVVCDPMHSQLPDDNSNYVLSCKVSSISSTASNTNKLQDEFMICVLNTEDLEVPNNDHVIFPDPEFPPISSNMEQSTNVVLGLVSADNVLSPNERDPVGGLRNAEEHTADVQPTVSSLKASPLSLPKAGVLQSCDGYAGGAEPPEDGSMAGCPTYAGNGVDEAKPCGSEIVGLNSTPVAAIKEESTSFCFENQDNADNSFASFLESHLQETDDAKIHPVNATDGFPDEANFQVGLQICLPQPGIDSAEPGFPDAVAMVSAYDQEEQSSDSEDGVPYFSDIEALILDMDLGSYDQESWLLSKEVSRYQHIDPKKTIRWEQSFISCTNRAISSHGAFAVFYGRHLKYFIKDPEVSIGRETEDVKVDIDLGREGRTNKISRRQAIIKMDENGLFSLKNIGKFPIFVNGQTVPAKIVAKLLPHSLVKIQDMHFAFEVNERAVGQYIRKMHGSCQDRSTFRFEEV